MGNSPLYSNSEWTDRSSRLSHISDSHSDCSGHGSIADDSGANRIGGGGYDFKRGVTLQPLAYGNTLHVPFDAKKKKTIRQN